MNYRQDIKNTFTFMVSAKNALNGRMRRSGVTANVNAPNRQITQLKRHALSGVFPVLRRD
jgi:hypothetical protein